MNGCIKRNDNLEKKSNDPSSVVEVVEYLSPWSETNRDRNKFKYWFPSTANWLISRGRLTQYRTPDTFSPMQVKSYPNQENIRPSIEYCCHICNSNSPPTVSLRWETWPVHLCSPFLMFSVMSKHIQSKAHIM